MEKDPTPFQHEQDTQETHVNTDADIVVPVKKEELTATRRPVERGAVRIEKDVVEERQTLDVPVTEVEVDITRRRVDREVTNADHAFEEGTINVPLHGEEVDVDKRARVVEEIDVDRRAVTTNEQVTGTIRREEVTVDDEGQVEQVELSRGDKRRNRR
jgi:uncharacterized protein (TIGR02271 family)